MAVFAKYIMTSPQDYRPNIDNHQVLLIKTIDGKDWAFGRFTTKDEDMLLLTQKEISELPEVQIPNISIRQCKQALLRQGKLDGIDDIISSIPDEMLRKEVEIFWEYSQHFERNHPLLSTITDSLGMDSDEVDNFFIYASKL